MDRPGHKAPADHFKQDLCILHLKRRRRRRTTMTRSRRSPFRLMVKETAGLVFLECLTKASRSSRDNDNYTPPLTGRASL